VKLLFDQNLSPRLIAHLADLYPDSSHVYHIGLDRASDVIVWEFAQQHGFVLVTRDVDFSELGLIRGFPPKIIWIRRGNCSTSDIEGILRSRLEDISSLESDPALGMVELY
jgi:predicted nuclease of predicted toxin-antitoxin system